MTAITIANTDYEIIEDVYDALAAATVSGAALFNSVSMAATPAQADECQVKGAGPNAIVYYETTTEDSPGPEEEIGCRVEMRIIVARKDALASLNEMTRLENVLKLINGAKNAVHAGTIANAHAWGDGNYYSLKFTWGSPSIRRDMLQPWAGAEIPLAISYLLSSATAH